MKRIVKFMLAPVLVLAMFTIIFASGPSIVVSNQVLPVSAVNKDGRVLIPLRAIFEALDATVDYDHATKIITGHKDGKIVILTVNDKVASVDGQKITLDVPATIIKGSTFVPIRFIGESLGANVVWANNTVLINSDQVIDKPDSVGEILESEIGTNQVVKAKNRMALTKISGPFAIKITDIQVSSLVTSKKYKELLNDKDRLTMVTIAIEVANNSTGTHTINPDQGNIITNTNEQAQANLLLSNSVGSDFSGKTMKKGNVVFLLDSKAQDIKNIKYSINAGFDENYNSVGNDIEFVIEF